MAIDPSSFHPINVVDTCGVWNILSSRLLHASALDARCEFCITETVRYECLDKPRKSVTAGETTLMDRLRKARKQGQFQAHSVDIADLQGVLNLRRRMGKGEISAIAFALKIGQAVLTDDQGARRRAVEARCRYVQTTPHLMSWLLFLGRLGDGDIVTIMEQHEAVEGTLRVHLDAAAMLARQCQLNARAAPTA